MARRSVRILLWALLGALVLLALAVALVLSVPAPIERWIEGRIQLALREHYQSEVQLQNLHVKILPGISATADNLVIPDRGDPGAPPLITVQHLVMQGNFFELLRTPVHVTDLQLQGMEIRVGGKRQSAAGGGLTKPRQHTHFANFVIDKVDADGAKLYILRADPSREPLLFDLRQLTLRSAGIGQPMKFTAQLTNPTPPGIIHTTGRFGPWNFDQPSATKVGGHYDFEHADLSVFNGISGTLSSVGDYDGALQKIVVDGTTDTPDFQLDRGGQSVHLTSKFHAIVDGTNGNTYLQPVNAHFLETDIVTNGQVASKQGEKGKTIDLDVDMQHARVQDVLALASKSEKPALTGNLRLKANLDLPPGKDPVLQKMLLNGKFQVSDARFTSDTIKKVVVELSRRGQGKPKDDSINDVAALFNGTFRLQDRTLTFSNLQFVVPGAQAQVQGSYMLRGGNIKFVGDVRLNATVSQMVTGNKRWLLYPFDSIFMKHGAGTYVPFLLTGTREHPDVHIQWKKLF